MEEEICDRGEVSNCYLYRLHPVLCRIAHGEGPSNIASFKFCYVQYGTAFRVPPSSKRWCGGHAVHAFLSGVCNGGEEVKVPLGFKVETLVGAIVSEVIMVVILMATVGVDPNSFNLNSVSALSKGLDSLADGYSPILFAIGIIRLRSSPWWSSRSRALGL